VIEHVKKKLSKRELFERDGFTKHGKAQPYKREPIREVVDLDDEEKVAQLQRILGDWEMEDGWLDKGDN